MLSMIQAGRVKALGVTGPKRLAALPDVPTIAEAGIPGYEVILWYGFFGPAGLPRETAAKIAADLTRVLQLPDVRERFAGLGVDPVGSSPEEFATFLLTVPVALMFATLIVPTLMVPMVTLVAESSLYSFFRHSARVPEYPV